MKKQVLALAVGLSAFFGATAFEGQITYRSYHNYSPETLKMQPLVYNGADTVTITVKDNVMVMNNSRTGVISIEDGKTHTEYSPADNTGFTCPKVLQDLKFGARKTDETRELLGGEVSKYVSADNAQVGMEMTAWVSDDTRGIPAEVLKIINAGLDVPGLVLKYTTSTSGQYATFVCMEVLDITPREVSEEEIAVIPAGAKMETVADWGKYKYKDKKKGMAAKFVPKDMKEAMAFGDLVTDFMAKHPASPSKGDLRTYELDENWDF